MFGIVAGDVGIRQDPAIIHERHGHNATSTNWAGYAVTGPDGSVTDVKGSWKVPAVNCSSPGVANGYASFWIGIDGYESRTVEQIGTDSDCSSGKPVYYAWYEFYPHQFFTINTSAPIMPNDTISAEVSYNPGTQQFTVSLSVNKGAVFSTSTKMNNARRSSAEWIAEAPSGGGIAALADFGMMAFNNCVAKVGNQTGSIGSFPTNVGITMISTKDSNVVKAQPSSLMADGFTVTWENPGP